MRRGIRSFQKTGFPVLYVEKEEVKVQWKKYGQTDSGFGEMIP